jgi:hypothetical protein
MRWRARKHESTASAGTARKLAPAWPIATEVDVLADAPVDPELSDEQEKAVFSYCRELLRQPTADEAATDALVGFWRLLMAHHDQGVDGPSSDDGVHGPSSDDGVHGPSSDDWVHDPPSDEVLLAITRQMVAVSMPDRGSPSERRQAMIASISAEPQCSCRESPFLLAARANGNIEPRESVALSGHLTECPECRGLDAHMERAERAFRAALDAAQAIETDAARPEAAQPDATEPEAAEPEAA